MEMSLAYMRESCEFLKTRGFDLSTSAERVGDSQDVEVHTFVLKRAEHEQFTLEAWCDPDGTERYYLEVVQFHGLTSTSFPLDSWKYKPHHIEFKYYVVDETSMGLSFILALDDGA